jgi:hypothetical protein
MFAALGKHFRWFLSGVVALLLVTVVASGMPGPATWANPPDGTSTPQPSPVDIEPFSFQLEHPPEGVVSAAADTSVRSMADPDWFEFMRSGFEGDLPSEGWEVQGTGWGRSSARRNSGDYSAAVESFDGAPATWLVYGGGSGFSLDDVADAKLNFAYWLDTDEHAYLGWAASADGVNFYGARTSGRVQSWLSGSLDLKHLIGDGSVWIAFAISGDGNGTGQNVYVDDVVIMAQEPYRTYLPLTAQRYSSCPFPCLIYHDDFSDPNSGWPREHSKYGKVEIDRDYDYEDPDGTYHMKIDHEWFTDIYAVAPNVRLPKNYVVQFAMRYDFWDWNADWGAVVNTTGEPGGCYMLTAVNASGSVMCKIRRRSAAGKEFTLASGGAKKLLRSDDGWRTVRVFRQGDNLRFEVHQGGEWIVVKGTQDAELSGGGVGFRIFTYEQGAEAWFDDLYVWDLGP